MGCCFIQSFPCRHSNLVCFPYNNKNRRTYTVPYGSFLLQHFVQHHSRKSKRNSGFKLVLCREFEKPKPKLLGDAFEVPKVIINRDNNLLDSIKQDEEAAKVGEIRRGRICRVTKEGLSVDLGLRKRAFLPRQELWLEQNKLPQELYKVGDELEVEILRLRNIAEFVVSEVSARRRKCWEQLKEFQSTSKNFSVLVLGCRNNGLIVRYDCIEGYLPMEHLIPNQTVSQIMNTELEVRVLCVEPAANNLVVSQRLTVAEKREKELRVGSIVNGMVRAVRDYGVVVDLYGVLGLLFIKDISCEPVEDPSAVFSVGETIQCMIIHIDRKRHRVILSTRALELRSGDILKDKAKVFEQKTEALKRTRKILEERSSQRKCFFGKNFHAQSNFPK